jgi:hypothetical protein
VSTRNRSQDLTADLLHDLADEQANPLVSAPSVATRSPAIEAVAAQPSPFLQTTLFLAPRSWLRPGIARSGASVSLFAGPVRLRLGRG